jgi:membrane protein
MKLRPLYELPKLTFFEWLNDNTFRMAASLAFYTIFSLAPIMVIAVSIAGLIFRHEQAVKKVVQQVEQLVGPQGAAVVIQVLENNWMDGGASFATLLGLATMIIGSTVLFADLQSALNQIWDVQSNPKRSAIGSLLRARFRSFGIVLAVGFLLLVSLIFSAALSVAQEYLSHRMPGVPWLWWAVDFATSFVVVSLLFAMIYRYLPDVKITWRDVSVGAVLTAVLFTVGKYLIGLYLGQMTFGSTYGAAGSFVVFLLWVYYSALICFFGAEFTQVFARKYGSKIHPAAHAVRVGRKTDSI